MKRKSGRIGSRKVTDETPDRVSEQGIHEEEVELREFRVDNTSTTTRTVGRPKKTFHVSSEEYALAARLLTLIRENLDPKAKADLQEWAAHVDRLHRIDERDFADIAKVIEWLHDPAGGRNAAFWRGNVLSTKSLRKQFQRLLVQMNGYMPTAKHLAESLAGFERWE
jgi:hypothetical protein